MASRFLYNAICGLFYFTVTATPLPGYAQPNTTVNSKALALFDTARALMAEGKFAEACPMLEEARSLYSGIGIMFNLADCHEHIGLTASAYAGFQDTAAAADVAGQPDRAQVARERAAALHPKLSKLRIVVPAEAAAMKGFEVRRNEASISRVFWGKDVPVDPGRHSISATAPQRELWSTTVLVTEPGKVVAVNVPILKLARVSEAGDTTSGEGLTARTAYILGGISGGIAVIGVGVGVGFTITANGKSSDADSLRSRFDSNFACYQPTAANAKTCEDLHGALTDQDSFSRGAVASFAVAGVFAVATGALMLYAGTKQFGSSGEAETRSTASSIKLVPVVDSTQKGLLVVGAW
jgi:serine/threonine-protein kinase